MPVRASELNIALPAIAADLCVSPANVIWIVNVYQIDGQSIRQYASGQYQAPNGCCLSERVET
jgi:hypothetical protein